MSTGNRHSVGRKTSKFGSTKFSLSAALLAMLAGTTAVGTSGCALPILGIIPSVVGLLFDVSTSKKDDTQTAKDGDVQVTTGLNDNDSNSSKGKMTPAMDCHLLALARPDLTVVELRKGTTGAPEYRELHLEQLPDDATWNPVVDTETGPSGWRPAVNFLSMDFKPPLTEVIPDSGTCYLAYAPIARREYSEPGGGIQIRTWRCVRRLRMGRPYLPIPGSAHAALHVSVRRAIRGKIVRPSLRLLSPLPVGEDEGEGPNTASASRAIHDSVSPAMVQ